MKLLLMIVFFSLNCFALEVDEKLTLRILKTSDSRKTILINRGLEDGLVKGDHAKFFMTIGVVARAVMIKGSPSRSVWSVYRMVNSDFIKPETVMNLKVTPAVKITKDESKMLVKEDLPGIVKGDPRDLGIALAPGAEDIKEEEKLLNDVANLSKEMIVNNANISKKTSEIFSTFFMGEFSAETIPNDNGNSFSTKESITSINLGYEQYFSNEKSFLSNISIFGKVSLTNSAVMAFEGSTSTENSTEFGGGVSIYPFSKPHESNKFLWFGSFEFMLGTVSASLAPGDNSISTAETVSGKVTSYAFGGGLKFYTSNGLGARMQLDFYNRGDEYSADSNNTVWIKSKSGPRVTMGLSYRF